MNIVRDIAVTVGVVWAVVCLVVAGAFTWFLFRDLGTDFDPTGWDEDEETERPTQFNWADHAAAFEAEFSGGQS